MNDTTLTKDASDVLKKLYKEYKKRLDKGMSKSDAADFDSSKAIHADLFPDRSFEDVDSACVELLRVKLLKGLRADGYVYRAALTDDALAYCQQGPAKSASNFFGQALELVQAIRSLLPW